MTAENLALRDELMANAQARYEDMIAQGKTEEEAFAKAYLALGLTDLDTLQETKIENNGKTYRIQMIYQAIETINVWQ